MEKINLGFNEFCSPSLEKAFQEAMQLNPKKNMVVTRMMTLGGEHSAAKFPPTTNDFRQRNPNIVIDYVWFFELTHGASVLAPRSRSLKVNMDLTLNA